MPKKLIASIESAYNPINLYGLDNNAAYYIHVLGTGATMDSKLPPTMNLGQEPLKRLIEGVRLNKHLNHAVLVTSAASKKLDKCQAEIAKVAAISLGVDSSDIKMLKTPMNTLEEAQAFKTEFGTDKQLILVTSAVHMPRAVEIFRDQGLNVIAAPSSYDYKQDGQRYNGITFPSFNSIELMNRVHIAHLKLLYYRVFKKE